MNAKLTEEQKIRIDEVYNRVKECLIVMNTSDQHAGQFMRFADESELRGLLSELYSVCLAAMPDQCQMLVGAACLHRRLGEDAEALGLMERVCQLDTQTPALPLEASQLAANLADLDKALYYAEEAVKRGPEQPNLLANYAINLLYAARDEEALDVIEQALLKDEYHMVSQNVLFVIAAVMNGECERPILTANSGSWLLDS